MRSAGTCSSPRRESSSADQLEVSPRKEISASMAPEAILEHALRRDPVAGFRRVTVSQGASIGVEPDMESRAL